MVPPIDKNNIHWLTGECFRGAQSGESTANNNDLLPQSILRNILSGYSFRSGPYPLSRVNMIGLWPKLFATVAPSSSEMSLIGIFPSLSTIVHHALRPCSAQRWAIRRLSVEPYT
jgi:hypothetical protein